MGTMVDTDGRDAASGRNCDARRVGTVADDGRDLAGNAATTTATPTTTPGDAIAQADHFLAAATPAKGDLLPVLDLERSGGLTQTQLVAWVQAYVGRIYQRLGVRATIYVSPNFWKNYMGDTTWFATSGFNVLWIAHWTTATTPLVPGANWGGKGWAFWQYTSDGTVPGIGGRVDLDRYNGKIFTRVQIP